MISSVTDSEIEKIQTELQRMGLIEIDGEKLRMTPLGRNEIERFNESNPEMCMLLFISFLNFSKREEVKNE